MFVLLGGLLCCDLVDLVVGFDLCVGYCCVAGGVWCCPFWVCLGCAGCFAFGLCV